MADHHPSDRPQARPGLETAYLDGEAVVFDEAGGQVHLLNPTASAVWLLCDGATSVDAMTAELADLFAQPLEVVVVGVRAALDQLDELGLLHGAPIPAHEPAGEVGERGPDGVVYLPQPPDP